MSEPARFFEDLEPAARTRVLKRLEKPGPDGIVPAEHLLIRQHLRPSLRRLRPERQKQLARQLLAPVEPFLVDREADQSLPLIPRSVLRPLIRHLSQSLPTLDGSAIDWSSLGGAGPSLRDAVAAHLTAGREAAVAAIAGTMGGSTAVAARSLELICLCLSQAELIETWCREVPAGPILWVDGPLVDRIILNHTRAEATSRAMGRMFLVLLARRLTDPSQLAAALAAVKGAPPSLHSDVQTIVTTLAEEIADEGLSVLEKRSGEDALAAIDYFRIHQLLNAAEMSGAKEQTEARLTSLLGRVASGTLQTEVSALLAKGTGAFAAGEVERSLRELGVLVRDGGFTAIRTDLEEIERAIVARLKDGDGEQDTYYHLYLLELCSGPDRAAQLLLELRPRRSMGPAG